jgi:hypothetical protein
VGGRPQPDRRATASVPGGDESLWSAAGYAHDAAIGRFVRHL